MILAAGLLVLLGLGLFVAGILTGVTVLYWAVVAVCLVAAVLIVVARRRLGATPPEATTPPKAKQAEGEPAEKKTPERAPEPAESAAAPAVAVDLPDPGVEEVEVTDLLVVVDLKDEVLVVDEHPRYHVEGCAWLAGRETIPLPLDEARTDGFTPCAVCSPDRTLAERARSRKHSGS